MTQKKFTRAYARRIIDKVLKTLTLIDILSKKTPYLQVFGIRLDTFNSYFLDYNIHLRTFARKKRRNETFHNKHQLEKFRIYRLRLP